MGQAPVPSFTLSFALLSGVVSGAMLLIEDDPRIDPDTVWTELIVSATVSQKLDTTNQQSAGVVLYWWRAFN